MQEHIMHTIATNTSIGAMGVTSPYPTDIMVVTLQYKEYKYLISVEGSGSYILAKIGSYQQYPNL